MKEAADAAHFLCSLWLILVKNIEIRNDTSPDAVNERMQKFLHYIDLHYQEEISLEQLADCASVSKSECTRCFRRCIRTTPYRYLTEYRLAKAAKLLGETDLPVSTIALDVGFRQVSHFGKCFREKTGFTPREYRNQKGGSV